MKLDLNQYEDQNVILEGYHKQVLNEIERMKKQMNSITMKMHMIS